MKNLGVTDVNNVIGPGTVADSTVTDPGCALLIDRVASHCAKRRIGNGNAAEWRNSEFTDFECQCQIASTSHSQMKAASHLMSWLKTLTKLLRFFRELMVNQEVCCGERGVE
jgi:hypothetical protein